MNIRIENKFISGEDLKPGEKGIFEGREFIKCNKGVLFTDNYKYSDYSNFLCKSEECIIKEYKDMECGS